MGVPLQQGNNRGLMNQEVIVGLIILLAVGFILAKLEHQRRDSEL
jgi:hypothetical protein